MRNKQFPPLPERDKRRSLEYWRNRPFGSVTIQRNPHVPTAVPFENNDAPVDDIPKNTMDSNGCESQGTVAPSPIGDPTQVAQSVSRLTTPVRTNKNREGSHLGTTHIDVKRISARRPPSPRLQRPEPVPTTALRWTKKGLGWPLSWKSRCAMTMAARAC